MTEVEMVGWHHQLMDVSLSKHLPQLEKIQEVLTSRRDEAHFR